MTTLVTLRNDVNDRLVRSFSASLLNSFNRIAEAMIARDLRVGQMLTRTTLTLAPIADTAAGSVALPTGWLEFRSVTLDNAQGPRLQFLTPDLFFSNRRYFSGEAPESMFTIEGDTIYAAPGGSSDLYVSYYGRFTEMTADDDTTWLLTNHYDVHLHAMLYAAADYEQDDALMARFLQQYEAGIRELNRNDRRARTRGAANETFGTVGP